MNPLRQLRDYGQSVWLDYIRRDLITSGELRRLVEEDGVRGVTSNLTIFEKAIAGSTDYDEALRAAISSNPNAEPIALFEKLAIEGIRMAADVLRPVYDDTNGGDGFVSIEVSPLEELARNDGFRRTFRAPADVGGRYSALTVFGLVPAALIGVDVERLLDRAWRMAEACAACVAAGVNPGLSLGAALGELAAKGRDKVTFIPSTSPTWNWRNNWRGKP